MFICNVKIFCSQTSYGTYVLYKLKWCYISIDLQIGFPCAFRKVEFLILWSDIDSMYKCGQFTCIAHSFYWMQLLMDARYNVYKVSWFYKSWQLHLIVQLYWTAVYYVCESTLHVFLGTFALGFLSHFIIMCFYGSLYIQRLYVLGMTGDGFVISLLSS